MKTPIKNIPFEIRKLDIKKSTRKTIISYFVTGTVVLLFLIFIYWMLFGTNSIETEKALIASKVMKYSVLGVKNQSKLINYWFHRKASREKFLLVNFYNILPKNADRAIAYCYSKKLSVPGCSFAEMKKLFPYIFRDISTETQFNAKLDYWVNANSRYWLELLQIVIISLIFRR